MPEDKCIHNIAPKESCSYCSGRKKKSDFSGIARGDTKDAMHYARLKGTAGIWGGREETDG